MHSVIY